MSSPNPRPFHDLLDAAQAGSADALGELMESVRPQLRAFLRSSVGGKMRRYVSVSDLEQDVLLGAQDLVRRLPKDAGPTDLQALLLKHAHWAIGKASRRNERLVGESAVPEHRAEAGESAPTMGKVTAADELERLEQWLDELPEGQADVVRLRRKEMTFERIGEQLGIGADAARKRFLQAARTLRSRSEE